MTGRNLNPVSMRIAAMVSTSKTHAATETHLITFASAISLSGIWFLHYRTRETKGTEKVII